MWKIRQRIFLLFYVKDLLTTGKNPWKAANSTSKVSTSNLLQVALLTRYGRKVGSHWNKKSFRGVLTLICINWVPGDPRSIFLVTSFTRKMPESSDSMYSSIFMLENIWYHHFNRGGPNSQEIVNFIPNMGPGGTKLNWSKIHNFLWIRFTLGKIMISYDF